MLSTAKRQASEFSIRTQDAMHLKQTSEAGARRNPSPGRRGAWAVACAGLLVAAMARGGEARATTDGSAEPFPSATPQAVVDVSRRIFPAVVRLDVAQETYAEGKRTVKRGIG